MRGDVLGVERRRRWSDDEKLAIVVAAGELGATVTQVAQRHEVTRSQIYGWRRDLNKKGLWSPAHATRFLSLDLPDIPTAAPVQARSVPVELRLINGRCLRFDSSLDVEVLTRLIRAVEAA